MKAYEAKNILEKRLDFLDRYTPIIFAEWVEKQKEAIKFAIKAIIFLNLILKDHNAYIVDFKDGKIKVNVGGKEYEI